MPRPTKRTACGTSTPATSSPAAPAASRTAGWGVSAFVAPSVDKKGSLDGSTGNGADFWNTVPNHQVRAVLDELAQNATPAGQLRSVAPGCTPWAVESMIDELAHAACKD